MKKTFTVCLVAAMLAIPLSVQAAVTPIAPVDLDVKVTSPAAAPYLQQYKITKSNFTFIVPKDFGYIKCWVKNPTKNALSVKITRGTNGAGDIYVSFTIPPNSQTVIPNYGKVAAGQNFYTISFSTPKALSGLFSIVGSTSYGESQ